MVAAELLVVAALVVVTWNVVASANRAASGPAALAPAPEAAGDTSPLPHLPEVKRHPAHGPLPGLSLDSDYWRERLAALNADQVYLERLEWQIVRSAQAAAQRYIESVVLPAIRRAEQQAGGVAVSG